MGELIYEVGIRPVPGALNEWEAFAPDLPGFRVLGTGYHAMLDKTREAITRHLASLLARRKGLPVPAPMMTYMHDTSPRSPVRWHYLKVQMGPLPSGRRRVVDVVPDAEGYVVVE
ncbi:hypothetical protein GCM10027040_22330 [Halomonas shantousis]